MSNSALASPSLIVRESTSPQEAGLKPVTICQLRQSDGELPEVVRGQPDHSSISVPDAHSLVGGLTLSRDCARDHLTAITLSAGSIGFVPKMVSFAADGYRPDLSLDKATVVTYGCRLSTGASVSKEGSA